LRERSELLGLLMTTQIALFTTEEAKRREADWRQRFATVRDGCFISVREQLALAEAIRTVEARYFDGHGVLWPELAAGVEAQLRESQRLAVMAGALGEHDGSPSWD
jgi:hypothetical protein